MCTLDTQIKRSGLRISYTKVSAMDTQKCGNKEKLSILKGWDNKTAKLEIIKIKTALSLR